MALNRQTQMKDRSTEACVVRIVDSRTSSCISGESSTDRHRRTLATVYTSGILCIEADASEGPGNGVGLNNTT